MTHPRVLCLGEILWDCLADQISTTVDQVTSWTLYAGGAPANVACALTKLGTSAGFVGCIGEDRLGEQLVELLQEAGVDRKGIQRHASHPTRKVEVLRNEAGDRQFAGFGDRNTSEFADAFLQADLIPAELFENAEFLVLGTLGLAYPDTAQAIARAMALAKQHSLKIVIDVNWRPMFWSKPELAKPIILAWVKQADFLKLSIEEAEWLFDSTDAGTIARSLGAHSTGNVGVLITAGAQGCTYYFSHPSGDLEGKVPAFLVEVEDTTGAGDGFVAGFVHQLCQQGRSALCDSAIAETIVTYANAVGSLTTMRSGAIAAQPTAVEVKAFLYLNPVL
ncbi:MAG: carbohydrate kinase [Drouetiella hepatica Uher 2000/2452]|jgi:fructokinase|uniref:Carbohydrate kinase n=1 Tax=Drouetiella hepatica Uher 2000/2452 TaxID=904376 RepID=A0A951QBA3_9CYAN|nr:carbohydrate kinase [Drouetiella hepatica Uher 2000/2452]